MKLYHGSNQLFDKISLEKSRDKRDFGRGFYTTTLEKQARDWAETLFERYGGEGSFIYRLDFDKRHNLKILRFEGLTFEWLEFIRVNRTYGGIQHEYDVVMGPVANDNTMPTISLYTEGTLSVEAALIQLAYFKANDQVSFHTQDALQWLTLVEYEKL